MNLFTVIRPICRNIYGTLTLYESANQSFVNGFQVIFAVHFICLSYIFLFCLHLLQAFYILVVDFVQHLRHCAFYVATMIGPMVKNTECVWFHFARFLVGLFHYETSYAYRVMATIFDLFLPVSVVLTTKMPLPSTIPAQDQLAVQSV